MESKGYTIFSDGVVLEPFQREDGSWGWYAVEFVMDSRTYLGDGQEEEVNVNAFADTKDKLIVEWEEE